MTVRTVKTQNCTSERMILMYVSSNKVEQTYNPLWLVCEQYTWMQRGDGGGQGKKGDQSGDYYNNPDKDDGSQGYDGSSKVSLDSRHTV